MTHISISADKRDALVDGAFSDCLEALRGPAFVHMLGIGMAVGDDIRLGGSAVDRPSNVFSITKAVLARGVGRAIEQGIFSNLSDSITVIGKRHPASVGSLLAMTQSWQVEPDMDEIERQADDPLPTIIAALGSGPTIGLYVNAGMHLLMRELHQRTGSALGFLQDQVLGRAGITSFHWESDATGVPWGHAHLHLSVRDMLMLGRHWSQEPTLVPGQEDATPSMAPETLPYANGFWIGDGYLLAAGWGGQCLIIVPAADAVLVALGNTGWNRESNRDNLQPGWCTGRKLFQQRLFSSLGLKSASPGGVDAKN